MTAGNWLPWHPAKKSLGSRRTWIFLSSFTKRFVNILNGIFSKFQGNAGYSHINIFNTSDEYVLVLARAPVRIAKYFLIISVLCHVNLLRWMLKNTWKLVYWTIHKVHLIFFAVPKEQTIIDRQFCYSHRCTRIAKNNFPPCFSSDVFRIFATLKNFTPVGN